MKIKADWDKIENMWINNKLDINKLISYYDITENTLKRKINKWKQQQKYRSTFDTAKMLYNDLANSLKCSISNLRHEKENQTTKEARERTVLIRAHQRALQTLMDCEKQLEPSNDNTPESGSGILDLDAARDEIMRRLARLAASGATAGIPA